MRFSFDNTWVTKEELINTVTSPLDKNYLKDIDLENLYNREQLVEMFVENYIDPDIISLDTFFEVFVTENINNPEEYKKYSVSIEVTTVFNVEEE